MDSPLDLPKRPISHDTAAQAEEVFTAAIRACGLFVVQSKDLCDYGTDVQIEARDDTVMANLRVHVQLKGTLTAPNADNSVSIQVATSNLGYLLAQRDSLYVCCHIPTKRLLVRYANDVYHEYEHRDAAWGKQREVTVRFTDVASRLR